jgi:hypothetical protein
MRTVGRILSDSRPRTSVRDRRHRHAAANLARTVSTPDRSEIDAPPEPLRSVTVIETRLSRQARTVSDWACAASAIRQAKSIAASDLSAPHHLECDRMREESLVDIDPEPAENEWAGIGCRRPLRIEVDLLAGELGERSDLGTDEDV